MAIKISQNQFFNISRMVIFPVPKIMAFGGVPTGSMKAQFAATAHGTMSAYGWIFSAIASDATTGNIIVPVAVLDVISVKNRTTVVDTATITMKFIPTRNEIGRASCRE